VDDSGPRFGDRTATKRAGEAASAAVALPVLFELIPGVTSLVQVGFGNGEWLAEARRLGVAEVYGIDGPWATLDDLLVGRDLVTIADTRQPFGGDGRTYDLAICTEYAEHLPSSRAASFVADLAALAPVVAFSAAIPGQGGVGHVNEQWLPYWEAHFAAVGYRMVDAVRRRLWNAAGMPAYLAQNLVIAVDERRLTEYPRLADEVDDGDGGVLSLVHPRIFERRVRASSGAKAPTNQLSIREATRGLARALMRRPQRRR
jgi:hypothetical protein